MCRKYQILAKVKATSTDKLFDSLPRNDGVTELCAGEFNMAYCCDPAVSILGNQK
jgi:hypothetical protein